MSLDQDLYVAVGDGNEQLVGTLLAQGADPNVAMESGMRPILVAAQFFPFLIEPLVAAGAWLGREYRDIGSGRMLGPMNFAAREESGESIDVLVRLGMSARENEDAVFDAAFQAIVSENIRRLVAIGCDPDVRVGTNRNTPLLISAYFGHIDSVRVLTEVGASLDARDFRGNTPLSFAVHGGHSHVVKILLDAGVETEPGMERAEFWTVNQFGTSELPRILRMIASHQTARVVGEAMQGDESAGSPEGGKPGFGVL